MGAYLKITLLTILVENENIIDLKGLYNTIINTMLEFFCVKYDSNNSKFFQIFDFSFFNKLFVVVFFFLILKRGMSAEKHETNLLMCKDRRSRFYHN